jgi:hypothetical protein
MMPSFLNRVALDFAPASDGGWTFAFPAGKMWKSLYSGWIDAQIARMTL